MVCDVDLVTASVRLAQCHVMLTTRQPTPSVLVGWLAGKIKSQLEMHGFPISF